MAESVSAYIQDDQLVQRVKRLVDEGEYRNMSHATEAAFELLVKENDD